jgi:hypothetical protein
MKLDQDGAMRDLARGRKVRTQHQGQPRRGRPVRQLLAVFPELNRRAAVRFLMAPSATWRTSGH